MTQEPMIDHLLKEDEALLSCLRTFLGSNDGDRLAELLEHDLDWTYLIQSAAKHRIIPILYKSISSTNCPDLPQVIIDKLRINFNNNAMKNLAMTGELLRILSLFESHDISAISFKGPVLASSVYGALSLRQFDDVDIIVPLAKISEIGKILLSEGYKEEIHESCKVQKEALLKYQHHHNFYSENAGVNLEIHWTLSPKLYSLQLDMATLWDRTEQVILQGKKIFGLSYEDTLLFLCEHGARHRWCRLSWICDVAALLRVGGLDWEYISDHAREWRSERALHIGLFLAKSLLSAPVPDEVNARVMQDKKVRALAFEVVDNLFQEGRSSAEIPSDPVLCNIQDQLFYIRARDRLSDKARLYLRMATTPTIEDWTFLPLPDHFFFLYRLIRPIRQAKAHRLMIVNWLFR